MGEEGQVLEPTLGQKTGKMRSYQRLGANEEIVLGGVMPYDIGGKVTVLDRYDKRVV